MLRGYLLVSLASWCVLCWLALNDTSFHYESVLDRLFLVIILIPFAMIPILREVIIYGALMQINNQ